MKAILQFQQRETCVCESEEGLLLQKWVLSTKVWLVRGFTSSKLNRETNIGYYYGFGNWGSVIQKVYLFVFVLYNGIYEEYFMNETRKEC